MSNEEGARSFSRAIELIADGELTAEASESLQGLLEMLREQALAKHGTAKGELKLTLKLGVDAMGVVECNYDIAVKEPKRSRPKGVLWLTSGANLTAHNPRQQKLPLREVGGSVEPPREVAVGASSAKEV